MASIVIEQDNVAVRNSFELHRHASLEMLRLAKARIASADGLDASGGVLSTEISFERGAARRAEHELTLGIDFKFKIRHHKSKSQRKPGEEMVAVECTFEATYSLTPEFAPTTEQIEAFHLGNAVFNCWPFFREFIQNTVLRLSYPPPPIPFLRLQPKQIKEPGQAVKQQRVTKRKAAAKTSTK